MSFNAICLFIYTNIMFVACHVICLYKVFWVAPENRMSPILAYFVMFSLALFQFLWCKTLIDKSHKALLAVNTVTIDMLYHLKDFIKNKGFVEPHKWQKLRKILQKQVTSLDDLENSLINVSLHSNFVYMIGTSNSDEISEIVQNKIEEYCTIISAEKSKWSAFIVIINNNVHLVFVNVSQQLTMKYNLMREIS